MNGALTRRSVENCLINKAPMMTLVWNLMLLLQLACLGSEIAAFVPRAPVTRPGNRITQLPQLNGVSSIKTWFTMANFPTRKSSEKTKKSKIFFKKHPSNKTKSTEDDDDEPKIVNLTQDENTTWVNLLDDSSNATSSKRQDLQYGIFSSPTYLQFPEYTSAWATSLSETLHNTTSNAWKVGWSSNSSSNLKTSSTPFNTFSLESNKDKKKKSKSSSKRKPNSSIALKDDEKMRFHY